jgi:hypothetical protein
MKGYALYLFELVYFGCTSYISSRSTLVFMATRICDLGCVTVGMWKGSYMHVAEEMKIDFANALHFKSNY